MGLNERLNKLEREAVDAEASLFRGDDGRIYDLGRLTDDELLAFAACYDERGEFIPERFTPELQAAWDRACA